MRYKSVILLLAAVLTASMAYGIERQKLNFNANWLLKIGDAQGAKFTDYDDADWQHVTLPRAWNESEAFKVTCPQLSDTVVWYRKHFTWNGEGKAFIEFEGVKWGADVFLNGHELGLSENGVMAFGFDLTPYLYKGQNVIAVRVDNSWNYREKATGQRYQWNNKNFNANYGGIPKNVWLHLTGDVYQTLPLYSNLGTTGTYIYGKDYDIPGHAATIHAESQVRNESANDVTTALNVVIKDKDGKEIAHFRGKEAIIPAGKSVILSAEKRVSGLHFWSWGYGYLYNIMTSLENNHNSQTSNLKPQTSEDEVVTRTGFRKAEFKNGMVYLNDRIIMMHGYAQRTSNEWPGVGMSVPAWLSDYSNDLLVKSGGNLVRWMHVTPWKQDVESCDRVGLIQAMPAGDAERDINGRQWEQRCLLMRDAIIYNRNNPSILFYEGGNESINREHMIELRQIRDKYDPNGGRAIGSREMLDIDEAEYGGEMLYVNKSEHKPMWAMEYYRDEGLRKYWDEYSYPFHKEGDGPLYRGKPAPDYNHNMDAFACGQVKHWFDYYLERPGTGRRVNSGGAKIVFSDTQTHWRGEANYRTSGVTDPMRIPKDAFYAMQVMWDGWVTPEKDHTYIVGHWNYPEGTVKPVYVISNSDSVRLLVNGKDQGKPIRSYNFLYTFPNVKYEAGKIEALSYSKANHKHQTSKLKPQSSYSVETAGEPDHLKLTTIQNPLGFKADGADLALVQVEVVDKEGRRCPLDNRMVKFKLNGKGEWLGGIANPVKLETDEDYASRDTNPLKGNPGRIDGKASVAFDNFVGHDSLPVECGVNRVMLRSDTIPGAITLTAEADGMQPQTITLTTKAVDKAHDNPSLTLPCRLDRGETPTTPSFQQINEEMTIVSTEAGSNAEEAAKSYDDNELSEWKSDGEKANAWITYHFSKKGNVSEIAIKPAGWRLKCYPLAVYAGKKKVWQGLTNTTLGYVHIRFDKPVNTDKLTIRMLGPTTNNNSLGDVKELAGGNASELDRIASKPGKTELRIVEVSFLCKK